MTTAQANSAPSRRLWIETVGCQMNVHDSQRMDEVMATAGFDRAEDDADADIVILPAEIDMDEHPDYVHVALGTIREKVRRMIAARKAVNGNGR